MVNKVTVVGLGGGDRPNHPLDPPLSDIVFSLKSGLRALKQSSRQFFK